MTRKVFRIFDDATGEAPFISSCWHLRQCRSWNYFRDDSGREWKENGMNWLPTIQKARQEYLRRCIGSLSFGLFTLLHDVSRPAASLVIQKKTSQIIEDAMVKFAYAAIRVREYSECAPDCKSPGAGNSKPEQPAANGTKMTPPAPTPAEQGDEDSKRLKEEATPGFSATGFSGRDFHAAMGENGNGLDCNSDCISDGEGGGR